MRLFTLGHEGADLSDFPNVLQQQDLLETLAADEPARQATYSGLGQGFSPAWRQV